MADESVSNLRNALVAFVGAQGHAASSREIVAEFRAKHATLIVSATLELEDLGLMKLVDEVSRRRRTPGDPLQGDLFGGNSLPRAIVVPVFKDGRRKHVRTEFLAVTFRQAETYSRQKPRVHRETRDKGVAALLETLRPFVTSPEQTVGELLSAAKEGRRAEGAAI